MRRAEILEGVRMLKLRDVPSRWEAKQISQLEAAELIGVSERTFRRWTRRFEEEGEAGLVDRRLGKPSPRGPQAHGLDGVDGPLTASVCQSWVVDNTNRREPPMKEVTTIGLDLAKAVFQVHGVDAVGAVAVRRALRRSRVLTFFAKLPPCLVGMEACATWAFSPRA
jgi:hypothetical protein